MYVTTDNDWLFIGCHDGRIVATRRVTRVVRDPVIARVVTLAPEQVWGADIFCLPEHRHNGVSRHLINFSDAFMASLGYKELLATVEAANTPMIRSALRGGVQFLLYVSYVRLLFYQRLRVSKDNPGRLAETVALR